MRPRSALRIRASQALLFAPALLLGILALAYVRNSFSRPVLRAGDSPDASREAVVFITYPPAYPFSGEVEAFLELRRLPGHEVCTQRLLGRHRWASEAVAAYHLIEWGDQNRVVLRSRDRSRTMSLNFDDRELEGIRPRPKPIRGGIWPWSR